MKYYDKEEIKTKHTFTCLSNAEVDDTSKACLLSAVLLSGGEVILSCILSNKQDIQLITILSLKDIIMVNNPRLQYSPNKPT